MNDAYRVLQMPWKIQWEPACFSCSQSDDLAREGELSNHASSSCLKRMSSSSLFISQISSLVYLISIAGACRKRTEIGVFRSGMSPRPLHRRDASTRSKKTVRMCQTVFLVLYFERSDQTRGSSHGSTVPLGATRPSRNPPTGIVNLFFSPDEFSPLRGFLGLFPRDPSRKKTEKRSLFPTFTKKQTHHCLKLTIPSYSRKQNRKSDKRSFSE